MIVVAIDRERIMLANVAGEFYALRDMCGHRNAPLSRGKLDGHVVECPLHFAQFDVRTGKLVDGPVSADVACYETRVDGDTKRDRHLNGFGRLVAVTVAIRGGNNRWLISAPGH